jgi:hypothetical protein
LTRLISKQTKKTMEKTTAAAWSSLVYSCLDSPFANKVSRRSAHRRYRTKSTCARGRLLQIGTVGKLCARLGNLNLELAPSFPAPAPEPAPSTPANAAIGGPLDSASPVSAMLFPQSPSSPIVEFPVALPTDDKDIDPKPHARSGSSPPPCASGGDSSVFCGLSAISLLATNSTFEVLPSAPPKDGQAAPSVHSRSKKKRDGHKKGSGLVRPPPPRIGCSDLP